MEWSFPLSCSSNVRVGIVPGKLAGLICHETGYAAQGLATIDIASCIGLHKGVLHVVKFVVRTKGDVVVTHVARQVVFQHPDILFEGVQSRRIFGTDVDGFVASRFYSGSGIVSASIFNIGQWCLVTNVATVAYHGQSHAQFVVERTTEARVKFGHKRMHVVVALKSAVYEVINIIA